TMAMMSDVDMPLEALRIQIASAINLIVQTGRLSDGSRCVTHITEVLGYDQSKGAYVLADLYLREYKGQDERGRLLSTFHPTGALPRVTSTIEGLGHSLPPEMREAIRRQSKG
ncbi:MAG: hypothetical protein KC417_12160, partial [Myxococcales bacterium]|nr:hypothetical protein [Myxococcales bacterium]